MSIIKSIDDDIKNGIYLQTIEQKSEGVFDLIGGELWEASLLLCSYILSKPDDFTKSVDIVYLTSIIVYFSNVFIKIHSLIYYLFFKLFMS